LRPFNQRSFLGYESGARDKFYIKRLNAKANL
jgi:hypothetical protein